MQEGLRVDLEDLQNQVIQCGGDIDKACSALFEEHDESSPEPAEPSPVAWRQEAASGGLHSEFSKLRLESGAKFAREREQEERFKVTCVAIKTSRSAECKCPP